MHVPRARVPIHLHWLGNRLAVVLVLSSLAGCSGFAKRFQRDDVISARQIARQGADAFSAGDWQRAEEHYAKAVDVCPVDERVRSRYAETLWQRVLMLRPSNTRRRQFESRRAILI